MTRLRGSLGRSRCDGGLVHRNNRCWHVCRDSRCDLLPRCALSATLTHPILGGGSYGSSRASNEAARKRGLRAGISPTQPHCGWEFLIVLTRHQEDFSILSSFQAESLEGGERSPNAFERSLAIIRARCARAIWGP